MIINPGRGNLVTIDTIQTVNAKKSFAQDIDVIGSIFNDEHEFIDTLSGASRVNAGTSIYVSNGGNSNSSMACGSQSIFLVPVWFPKTCSVDQVGTIAGANASAIDVRIGLYDAKNDGLPGEQVISAVTATSPGATLSGDIIATTQSPTLTIRRGNYWAALMSFGASFNILKSIPGNISSASGQNLHSGLYRLTPGTINDSPNGHLITTASASTSLPSSLSDRKIDFVTGGGVGTTTLFRSRLTAPLVFFRLLI